MDIIFKHPVAFICISYTKYTAFNETRNFLFILILPRHVSASLGHHQVLLLKLSHWNFFIICSFRCAYLFICLIPSPTLFPFSTSQFLIFTILKIYMSIIEVLKTLFLCKFPQLFLLGVLHSSSYVVCFFYHFVLLLCFVVFMIWFSSPCFVPCERFSIRFHDRLYRTRSIPSWISEWISWTYCAYFLTKHLEAEITHVLSLLCLTLPMTLKGGWLKWWKSISTHIVFQAAL
jgi:hypothetical protein